jgi:hypothetical protein
LDGLHPSHNGGLRRRTGHHDVPTHRQMQEPRQAAAIDSILRRKRTLGDQRRGWKCWIWQGRRGVRSWCRE